MSPMEASISDGKSNLTSTEEVLICAVAGMVNALSIMVLYTTYGLISNSR